MTRRGRTRGYWWNIARAMAMVMAAGLLAVTIYIVVLSVQAAQNALRPPQIPITQTPAEVGIQDYQELRVSATDGVGLRGWYVPPQADNGMVIVLLHGYAANRQALLPEAGMLARHGYGVALFDFRGHGESEPALVTIGEHEQRDLRGVIDWAAKQTGVKALGAVGFPMGGAVLAQVAAGEPRLKAVVIEAAYPSLDAEIRYRARVFGWLSQIPALMVMREAGIHLEGVKPVKALCKISPRRVLLIYGDRDALVPPGTAEAMKAAACAPAELWLVPGAEHQNYTQVAAGEYEQRLVRFFGK